MAVKRQASVIPSPSSPHLRTLSSDGDKTLELETLQTLTETLSSIHRSQLSHEKVLEQKLGGLVATLERMEANLPKQIAVEYAQINARMHNLAQSDTANGKLLSLPDDRGSFPLEFPKTAIIFALVDDEEVLKLLVHYGLSTAGDHKERRANLAVHCGVRLPQ